tara:strand:- start:476 stop:652 length:177 start_codon:yes stop_codon:yes gene_type:complete
MTINNMKPTDKGIIFNPIETEEMKYLKTAIQKLQDDVDELKDEVFLLKEWREHRKGGQ